MARWRTSPSFVLIALSFMFSGFIVGVHTYICQIGQEKNEDGDWKWVLPYEHPCGCQEIIMGGMNTRTPIRPFKPIYVDEPLLSTDKKKIRKHYRLECIASWGGWSFWGHCSTTCGNGTMSRSRDCQIPIHAMYPTCKGKSVQYANCSREKCPVWGDWSGWTQCSTTCDNGTQYRNKSCLNSDFPDVSCEAERPSESNNCSHGQCPEWGDWSGWTQCSTTCDNGTRYRNKTCMNSDFPAIPCEGEQPSESNNCSLGQCPVWGDWSNWTQCSTTCGNGTQYRNKTCVNSDFPALSCEGEQPAESTNCSHGQCPVWGNWSSWTQCSTTCGNGTWYRNKTCVNSDFPDTSCEGEQPLESKHCNKGQCPVWGEWEVWSQCSTTCGDGTQNREKTCLNSEFPNVSCDGEQPTVTKECKLGPCPVPLGMEDGTIADDQITASSVAFPLTNKPQEARLHNNKPWYATLSDSAPWIQVDFTNNVKIAGIQTQGSGGEYYVQTLQIQTGDSVQTLSYIMNDNTKAVFQGNSDASSVATIMLPQPTCARYLRIHPKTWSGWNCALRFEVLGLKQCTSNI